MRLPMSPRGTPPSNSARPSSPRPALDSAPSSWARSARASPSSLAWPRSPPAAQQPRRRAGGGSARARVRRQDPLRAG
jgi:hypothetical protein